VAVELQIERRRANRTTGPASTEPRTITKDAWTEFWHRDFQRSNKPFPPGLVCLRELQSAPCEVSFGHVSGCTRAVNVPYAEPLGKKARGQRR